MGYPDQDSNSARFSISDISELERTKGEMPVSTVDWLSSHWRAKSWGRTKEVVDLGLSDGDRVLDLGCGCGDMAAAVAALIGQRGYLLCVDSQPEMVEATKRRLAGVMDRADAQVRLIEDLALDPAVRDFDVVLLMNVVGYRAHPHELIELALSWVRPGGRLVVRSNDFRLSIIEPIDYAKYAELVMAAYSNQTYEYSSFLGATLPSQIGLIDWRNRPRRLEVRTSGHGFVAPFTEDQSRYMLGNLRALLADAAASLSESTLDYWRNALEPTSSSYLLKIPMLTFVMAEVIAIVHKGSAELE